MHSFLPQSQSVINRSISLLVPENSHIEAKIRDYLPKFEQLPEKNSFLFDGTLILDDSNKLSNLFLQQLKFGNRLFLPRLVNPGNKHSVDPKSLLSTCFDSINAEIISGLSTPSEYNDFDKTRPPEYYAKTLILLGSPLLLALGEITLLIILIELL